MDRAGGIRSHRRCPLLRESSLFALLELTILARFAGADLRQVGRDFPDDGVRVSVDAVRSAGFV